ncbi:DUF3800 domain-containing protein [Nonomuraea sp. NPDC059007]|uniref:DUF3800 domain-containing protein n=1 Tax=Nonomuraea sp. NPDC059007 TaxID=3346692 RepID=UPI0036A3E271
MSQAKHSEDTGTIFVDDSGDSRRIMVYSGLHLPDRRIPEALAILDDFRDRLAAEGVIPVEAPLHAVDLIGGRGRHFHSYGKHGLSRTGYREYLRDAVRRGLAVIADIPDISAYVVYRSPLAKKTDRSELYKNMLTEINHDLAESNRTAKIIIDGDGSNPSFGEMHYSLPAKGCRIDGGPSFLPAAHCSLLQAADLVAYAAYQGLARNPNRSFMWDWLKHAFPHLNGPLAR